MTKLSSFLNDKIAVSFNSDHVLFKQELIAFLTLCESNDVPWFSGDHALDEDMIDYLSVGECICCIGTGIYKGLSYSRERHFLEDGFTVVPSTDFFTVKD